MILYTLVCCIILCVIGWAGVSIFSSIGLKSDEIKGAWKRGIITLVLLAVIPCIVLIIIGYPVSIGILDRLPPIIMLGTG